jgi:hypothetical protein
MITFEQAWAATGYQYGDEELAGVRLGWELARKAAAAAAAPGPVSPRVSAAIDRALEAIRTRNTVADALSDAKEARARVAEAREALLSGDFAGARAHFAAAQDYTRLAGLALAALTKKGP